MGRLLLFLVLAAGISSLLLTTSARRAAQDTSRDHAEGQADVLVREIAEAGQAVALTQMVGDAGFEDPTVALGDRQAYDGGAYEIDYTPGTTDHEATVRVTGTYGGAVHTIETLYAYDPLDAPGPLWLDVPHVISHVVGAPRIDGGPTDKAVLLDRRKHDAQGLGAAAPLAGIGTALDAMAAAAGGADAAIPEASAWAGSAGLLEDLNVGSGEELYQRAVASMDASDATLVGDQTVNGVQQWGASTDGERITHVDGDLHISGTVRGNGALLVNGALHVVGGATLDWNGIVIVRSDDPLLDVQLLGDIVIDGMMVVVQEASLVASATGPVTALAGQLASGGLGTVLTLHSGLRLTFDLDEIEELADKLGFDGIEVHVLSTASSHVTAAEARSTVVTCHMAGTSTEQTLRLSQAEFESHLAHGDTMGDCGSAPAGPPAGTDPNAWIPVCHPPYGAATGWVDEEIKYRQLPHYLSTIPGAVYGTCASNGL